jgi:predicted RNA-binding protein YlxR (DUF448 family)
MLLLKKIAMKHIPLRSCIICWQKFPKDKLLAITRISSGEIFVGQHISGRSVYLCSALCAQRLQRKDNLLQRLLNTPVNSLAIQREVENYFSSLIPTE